MHLVEVQLRNWRSYRNATFTFPVPERSGDVTRRVILVGAQNGVGKTSFLIALYLGLFGRAAMHLIEGVRVSSSKDEQSLTYRNLLERTIHRPALQTDDPYALVRLRFLAPDGDEITIRRKWGFRRGGKVRDLNTPDGEEVIIDVNGDSAHYQSWQDANDRIAELLFPSNVMPCFFFDGEQAQERVEAAGGRALLDAVKTLYGTGLLDELRQSLMTFVNNEKTALRKDIGSVREDELNQKREELERIKQDLEKVAEELKLKRRHAEELEAARLKHTNELFQLVGDSQADVSQYAESIKALQTEQTTLRQKLVAGMSALSLPIAMAKVGQEVVSTVEAERIRDEWIHLKQAAMGKASGIVEQVLPQGVDDGIDPPLSPNQRDVLKTRLETALEALWSPPPPGCAHKFRFVFLREADRVAVLSKIKRVLRQGIPDLQQTVLAWNTVTMQLREAQRKFEAIRDVEPRLLELKSIITEVGNQISKISAELNALENKEKAFLSRIKELRGAIGQMEKRQSIADPVQQKINVAYQVVEVLDEAGERLVPLCKEALEERCTYHFSRMISDEYRNFKVRFDADTEPRLEKGDQIVYVTALSGAQKRAFGLAFTLAVADVSRQQAPIVIDTPVGNMDSRYRDRVLRHVAECAPGQVIFLSHDEEISPDYAGKLEDHVIKTMLLDFSQIDEGSGVTSVKDGVYFGVAA